MLLWSVLHSPRHSVNADYERLGQPSVTLDDIRRFRQLDCKAPGHPSTTGSRRRDYDRPPRTRRRHERRDGHRSEVARHALQPAWIRVFDYNIYAVCGDGCMMEVLPRSGVTRRHLGLDNLCWVYDNNHITIEGNTRIAFTET